MLQDPPLELVELGAGLEAELIREPLPGCSQSGQRVGLTAGSVERKHQLTQEPLPQRMLTGEALELRHEFRAFAGREPRVDLLFERCQALLLEPLCLGGRKRLVKHVRQRRPAPQGERVTEHTFRLLGFSRGRRVSCRAHEALEAIDIELARLESQEVPA